MDQVHVWLRQQLQVHIANHINFRDSLKTNLRCFISESCVNNWGSYINEQKIYERKDDDVVLWWWSIRTTDIREKVHHTRDQKTRSAFLSADRWTTKIATDHSDFIIEKSRNNANVVIGCQNIPGRSHDFEFYEKVVNWNIKELLIMCATPKPRILPYHSNSFYQSVQNIPRVVYAKAEL